jgi:hypothetical protein
MKTFFNKLNELINYLKVTNELLITFIVCIGLVTRFSVELDNLGLFSVI